MQSTNEIISERGEVYGDFGDGITVESHIIDILAANHLRQTGQPLQTRHLVWLSKIVMKMARLSVSPTHIDSWADISGYATLVSSHLHKEQQNA